MIIGRTEHSTDSPKRILCRGLSKPRIVVSIVLLLLGLSPARLTAQDGPVVEVVTNDTASPENVSVPRWRLPVNVSVSVRGGYDDNPNSLTGNSPGSLSTSGTLNVSYEFGTSRTRASFRSGTGITYFPDLGGDQYDPNVSVSLDVTHSVNLRLSVTATTRLRYQAEPDFSSDLGIDRRAGDYVSSQNSFRATYQWLPRFSTVSSYSIGTVFYERASVSNAQDRLDHSFGQSLRFLFLPLTTVTADYRLGWVDYTSNNRDSYNHSVLGGVDHSFSSTLQGGLRAGLSFRSSAEEQFSSSDGLSPRFEGNLSYLVSDKTAVTWSATYSIEESYVITSSGRQTFRTGLTASHSITPRLNGNVSVYYLHGLNEGAEIFPGLSTASFTEDTVDFSLGLNYRFNRHLSANAGYAHTSVDSDLMFRSYSRNRYFGGFSLNF